MFTHLSFQHQSVNMMSSVTINTEYLLNQPNTSMRVRKLLHQARALESNTENGARRPKIKSIGIIVSRNYSITDYYKSLHDKNNQSDNNPNFLHGKNDQSNHSYRFLHVSYPCNYELMAFLATNQIKVILHRKIIPGRKPGS